MYRLLLLLVYVCDSETTNGRNSPSPPAYHTLSPAYQSLSPAYSAQPVVWKRDRVEFKRPDHTISKFGPNDESYKQPYHWLTFPVQLVLGNTVGRQGKKYPKWRDAESKVYLKSIEFYCFLPFREK